MESKEEISKSEESNKEIVELSRKCNRKVALMMDDLNFELFLNKSISQHDCLFKLIIIGDSG